MLATSPQSTADPLVGATQTAEAFVKLVDVNDAEALGKILHPEMVQFAKIGDKIMPFKAADFIQMVSDKKLGGSPRAITLQSVELVRGGTANVILHAVSEEYDFMYQIALAQDQDNWLVVGVMSDIQPVK